MEENKDTASDEEDDSIMKIYLDASMMVREIKCRTAFCYAVKKW